MNARRLILVLIGAMIVAGAGILFLRQRQAESELQAQNQGLRQQIEQSSQLAAENEGLSNLVAQAAAAQRLPDSQFSELLRLRGEVGRLRQQAKEVEALREANREVSAALAAAQKPSGARTAPEPASADFWPRDSWQFLGYATPDAALQSLLYARSRGDLRTFVSCTTGEVLDEMEKQIKGKSQTELAKMANREIRDNGKTKSVRIIKRQTLPDGTVSLTVSADEGDSADSVNFVLKKVGNEWKLAKVGAP